MEHINQSCKIVCVLRRWFPDNVVYKIRSHLKLAIDLNGYSNKELLDAIIQNIVLKRIDIVEMNKYIKKKYCGKRNNVRHLKKYQLIHIIQKYNIDIPIKRYLYDIYSIFVNKHVENIVYSQYIECKLRYVDTDIHINKDRKLTFTDDNLIVSLFIDKHINNHFILWVFTVYKRRTFHNFRKFTLKKLRIPTEMLISYVLHFHHNIPTTMIKLETLVDKGVEYYYKSVKEYVLDKLDNIKTYIQLANLHDRIYEVKKKYRRYYTYFGSQGFMETVQSYIENTYITLDIIEPEDVSSEYLLTIDNATKRAEDAVNDLEILYQYRNR